MTDRRTLTLWGFLSLVLGGLVAVPIAGWWLQ